MNNVDEQNKSDVILPSSDLSVGEKLVTEGIEEKIQQKEIKTTYIDKVKGIEFPAYVIDLTRIQAVVPTVMTTLSAFLVNEDEITESEKKQLVSVYILTPNQVYMNIGKGFGMTLFKMLKPFINATVPNAKVMFGTEAGNFGVLQDVSINNVRLDL